MSNRRANLSSQDPVQRQAPPLAPHQAQPLSVSTWTRSGRRPGLGVYSRDMDLSHITAESHYGRAPHARTQLAGRNIRSMEQGLEESVECSSVREVSAGASGGCQRAGTGERGTAVQQVPREREGIPSWDVHRPRPRSAAMRAGPTEQKEAGAWHEIDHSHVQVH